MAIQKMTFDRSNGQWYYEGESTDWIEMPKVRGPMMVQVGGGVLTDVQATLDSEAKVESGDAVVEDIIKITLTASRLQTIAALPRYIRTKNAVPLRLLINTVDFQ